jgi:hypothetical protein
LPEFPLGKRKVKKEKIRVLPRNTGGGGGNHIMILSGYLEKVKGIILENPSEGNKIWKKQVLALDGICG